MLDLIKIVSDSIELYKLHWNKVITAFAVLFLVSVAFGIIGYIVDFFSQPICNNTKDTALILIFCISPTVFRTGLNFVQGLAGIIIALSVMIPLSEMSKGKPISDWTKHVGSQLGNTLRVIAFQLALGLLVVIPVAILVALNIGLVLAMSQQLQSGNLFGIFAAGNLVVILLIMGLALLVSLIISFFTMFMQMELAINGRGLVEALSASFGLVKENLADCFFFGLLWFGITIAVTIVTSILTCCFCLGIVLQIFGLPLVLAPIQMLSTIKLWQQLGGQKSN